MESHASSSCASPLLLSFPDAVQAMMTPNSATPILPAALLVRQIFNEIDPCRIVSYIRNLHSLFLSANINEHDICSTTICTSLKSSVVFLTHSIIIVFSIV